MGLPITIAIIGRIGELCEFVLRKIWKGIVRVSVFFHWKYKDFNFNRDYPVPFTFGLIMTIAVMSVVFYASYEMENSYREISFLDSAYITLRTITKIGIGKYAPSEYYYIILGISFSGLIVFSTAFRVFKSNVAEWIRLVDEKIKKEKIIDFNFSEDSELEAKALHRLQKVLHSTVGPILSRLLLSTESKEKLKEVLLAHYRKRNVSAQAVVSTKTHLSQHSPSLKDGHSQVYIEVSDKETEISLKCSNAETQTTISESTMQLVQTDISFMIDRHRYKITRIPKNFLRVAPS